VDEKLGILVPVGDQFAMARAMEKAIATGKSSLRKAYILNNFALSEIAIAYDNAISKANE
jgi:hypothetical protein